MSKCSINRQDKLQGMTCYNQDELSALIKGWNESFPTNKITLIDQELLDSWNQLQTEIEKYNKQCEGTNFPLDSLMTELLWCSLNTKMKSYCKTESCWIDAKEVMQKIQKRSPKLYENLNEDVFLPKGTKEKLGWLSTTEIDNVMKQCEKAFPNFKYSGCVPSDHYILNPDEIPDLNALLRKGLKYSAIVFNLDESDQPGSHWITVFFDWSHQTIEHFDSTGEPPIENIRKFIDSFHPKKKLINKFPHQKGNSECGVFSLFYVKRRLEGLTFSDFQVSRIPDSEMENYRKFFFRPFTEEFSINHDV